MDAVSPVFVRRIAAVAGASSQEKLTMAQHSDIILPTLAYTRADYTALRAFCMKIPLEVIADRYYSHDSPQLETGLERYLLTMRDDLIDRAIVNNPMLAENLKSARRNGHITARTLDMLIQIAEAPAAVPQPHDPIAMWLRPRTTAALRSEHLVTLADLTALMRRRGPSWWRGVPRVGVQRAQALAQWVRKHEATLGSIYVGTYVPAADAKELIGTNASDYLVPLKHAKAPDWLDGSAGVNRDLRFSYIAASNDLEAIRLYLERFSDKPHTLRSYTKELERFLYWCVLEAGKPLSSVLVTDCEQYKVFLKAPGARFVGDRAPRSSARWRPFSKEPLSPASQLHAVVVVRTAFAYLVAVRYLAGNPWLAVKDPNVVERVHELQIDKALSRDLWDEVIERLTLRCQVPENSQDRIALAMMLLLGDSGLRREEVAGAVRCALKPNKWAYDAGQLTVIGKRNKERIVPVSPRTLVALRAHWIDRGMDFDDTDDPRPLLGPLVIPGHEAALERHAAPNAAGYTGDALYRLFQATLKRLRLDPDTPAGFTSEQFNELATASPHALRHTWGTLAVEDGMPLDVAQAILGHRSPSTTAIYVQAKTKRILEEGARYFAKRRDKSQQ
ncbi:integrase [Duganella sp. BJB488]|uniref:phage integrase family protein n=1 Tax=unclassified Duganella TaxID=2636909 RepID=UPI000E34714A|nr:MULTISPECIES: phage integrase family protein [unclassified Duganella]RFP13110.1 integrase [Duganella sp. BJB489]RFP17126.1 integrase [Duganella sp. BJB488]RFP31655.1 integrase [Duganella sp. BJB480]